MSPDSALRLGYLLFVFDVTTSKALREDEETDENGVFTSEDSIEIRRSENSKSFQMLLLQRHGNREDARSDENNAFMSEDSIGIRRANKGVEKKQ